MLSKLNDNKSISSITPFLIYIILLASGLFLSLRLGINDFHHDSAAEILFSRNKISLIIFQLKWADQTPLYFLLQHIWRIFGDSAFAIRSLNLVIQVGNIYLVYRLARHFRFTLTTALFAALWFGLSPLSIYNVRDGRMYPLMTFWFISLMLNIFLYIEKSKKKFILISLLTGICAFYTHLFSLIFVVPLFLLLAIYFLHQCIDKTSPEQMSYRRRKILIYLLTMTAFLSFFLIISIKLFDQNTNLFQENLIIRPDNVFNYLGGILYHFFINASWGMNEKISIITHIGFISVLLILMIRGVLKAPNKVRLLTGSLIMIVFVAGYIFSQYADMRPRYFTFISPLFFILISHGAVCRKHPKTAWKSILSIGLCLFILCTSVWLSTNKMHQRGPRWTELLHKINMAGLYQPVLYAENPLVANGPLLAAQMNHMPEYLQLIHPMRPFNPALMTEEMAQGNDIVLLVLYNRKNREYYDYLSQLDRNGYVLSRTLTTGVTKAEIFAREF